MKYELEFTNIQGNCKIEDLKNSFIKIANDNPNDTHQSINNIINSVDLLFPKDAQIHNKVTDYPIQ